MTKHTQKNQRIKHKYLAYLEEAKRLSVKSADVAVAAIADFEKSTAYKDFALFNIEQARRYKRVLDETINPKTNKPLAKATINARLLAVKAFFFWLADQSGYKSRIGHSDCDYFNPSANDSRIGNATRTKPTPDLHQVKSVIQQMPHETDIEKRNRALIAFAILSGVRADVLTSLKIGNINLEKQTVFQDARTVKTKFRKTMTTNFFPIGDDIEAIVKEWMEHLKSNLVYGREDPLFPTTRIAPDKDGGFAALGLERMHWASTGPVRTIFKQAFEAAGQPYFHPHSFRHTLATYGEKICKTPEEFKAWSQNLAHENVLTTFTSYGKVSDHRQAEIIQGLAKQGNNNKGNVGAPDAKTIARVVEHLATKARRAIEY